MLKRSLSSQKTSFSSEKTAFFSMELDFVFRKTVFRSKTSPKQEENSADLSISLSCFVV